MAVFLLPQLLRKGKTKSVRFYKLLTYLEVEANGTQVNKKESKHQIIIFDLRARTLTLRI